MTDNNSTAGTQEPPLNQSPATHSKRKPGRVAKKETVWTTVPLGMVKKKDKNGGVKYTMRRNGITHGEILAGRKVPKTYDLRFKQAKHATPRTYEVTFTSVSNRAKTFRMRLAAASLKGLFVGIVREIGNLRAVDAVQDFMVHFVAISEKPGMTEEILTVPYAEPLPKEQRPTTTQEIEPLTLED